MWRTRALMILIPVQFTSFAFQAITGIFVDRIDPAFYTRYHPLNGYIFVSLILVHIFLNWDWVSAKYGIKGNDDEK